MADAYEKRRLKWTPDWPLSILRERSANDNLPTRNRSAKTMSIVLGCAVALAVLLMAFQSSFWF
jgi:hypothetical protein